MHVAMRHWYSGLLGQYFALWRLTVPTLAADRATKDRADAFRVTTLAVRGVVAWIKFRRWHSALRKCGAGGGESGAWV